ncbi:hypothetical protein PIB30_085972, partial [Stylosanthes scabra]|nr:hypothetical protein [Stylosanthes scabra]
MVWVSPILGFWSPWKWIFEWSRSLRDWEVDEFRRIIRITWGKMMDHFTGAEEHLAQQRLRQKLDEVNVAAQTSLAPIQDNVNFTLQKAYFKCAYESFDRSRRQEEITNCVENCNIPLANVQQTFDTEMQKFQ